ncbi:hypothetical protein ACHAW6_008708 [Cyclotella cf. meneghiniana]
MLTHIAPQRPDRKRQGKYDTTLALVSFASLLTISVLCIFPSRYLCTIGVPPIFSFRWNLPPNLSCNPKQLDS